MTKVKAIIDAVLLCQNWPDRPGCQREADLEYTMSFEGIGEPPIYWCESCGILARTMDRAITTAFQERGSEFLESFRNAIDEAEGTKH